MCSQGGLQPQDARSQKTECVEKRDDALASALAAALRSKSQLGNALASALAAVLRSKSQLGKRHFSLTKQLFTDVKAQVIK
jgi:hypothetical protein